MKTIGLIGGMSFESTITYYNAINEGVNKALGGLHSARIWLYSVDFAPIERCQRADDWARTAEILGEAAEKLEACGADAIFICTNTMHKVHPEVQARVSVPLVHIATATAEAVKDAGVRKVGLLGTRYTLTDTFYVEPLREAGLDVLIPEAEAVAEINRIIFEELCVGVVKDSSRRYMAEVMADFERRGAQGVIFGCTEIGLLAGGTDTSLKVFDTTLIHAQKAVEMALEDEV